MMSTQYKLNRDKLFQDADTVSTYKMLTETHQTNEPNESSD